MLYLQELIDILPITGWAGRLLTIPWTTAPSTALPRTTSALPWTTSALPRTTAAFPWTTAASPPLTRLTSFTFTCGRARRAMRSRGRFTPVPIISRVLISLLQTALEAFSESISHLHFPRGGVSGSFCCFISFICLLDSFKIEHFDVRRHLLGSLHGDTLLIETASRKAQNHEPKS